MTAAFSDEALHDGEPPAGSIGWAEGIINQYESRISGPGADITAAHELPYVEAAAIFSLDDGARYERLKGILKTRGVGIGNWERRVREREYRIGEERRDLEEATKRQQAVSAKPAAGAAPVWAPLDNSYTQPVNGFTLFCDIRDAIRQFVSLDEAQATVVALWCMFTWVFEKTAENNPFLRIVSKDSNCGKSTLLSVLARLTRSAWLVSSSTKSVLVWKLEAGRATFLLDEADTFLQASEPFQNVLDAASRPDGVVALSVKGGGENWRVAEINVFIPIAIASIKKLRRMATVEGRSIHIWLQRASVKQRRKLTYSNFTGWNA